MRKSERKIFRHSFMRGRRRKNEKTSHKGDRVVYYFRHVVYAYQYRDYGGDRDEVDRDYEIHEPT